MARKTTNKELDQRVKEIETTDRSLVQLKAELRESAIRFRNLLDLSPDPIVVIQYNRRQLINHAFTNIFG